MAAGMSPLTPPPSMLSIVTMLPLDGGVFGVDRLLVLLVSTLFEGTRSPKELIIDDFINSQLTLEKS